MSELSEKVNFFLFFSGGKSPLHNWMQRERKKEKWTAQETMTLMYGNHFVW